MANKKTKGELIAIYRLEFYKKQKNWKLSSDVKKKSKESKILNETYNIETDSGKEDIVNLHNEAFIESDNNNIIANQAEKPESPTKPCFSHLTQEWQDQWQCGGDYSLNMDQEPVQDSGWVESEAWSKGGQFGEKVYGDEREQVVQDAGWTHTESWSKQFEEKLYAESETPYPTAQDMEVEQVYQAADWLANVVGDQAYGMDGVEMDGCAELSMDSYSEFTRGADLAPHSSETELTTPMPSNAGLSRLPWHSLAGAVRAQAALLAHLLHEAAHRQQLRKCMSLENCTTNYPDITPRAYSGTDYYPTRDSPKPDPTPPTKSFDHSTSHFDVLSNTYTKDPFVAGSFKCEDSFVGRGRGRLTNRVIGIGHGRPYRL